MASIIWAALCPPFTGQKLDIATGLMYYNARYYDRTVGHFISSDTLVPDPTSVWDYNRFMYARGNPMRFSDPTGHCATLADGSPDRQNDAQCWVYADEYYKSWYADPDYFSYGWNITPDEWYQYIATQEYATADFLEHQLVQFWSPLYTQWGVHHPLYNPPPQWHTPPPHPLESMCNTWDCAGVGLAASSLLLSAGGDIALLGCVAASGGGCVPVAVAFKAADAAVTLYAFSYTLHQYYETGSASDVDLAVALTDLVGIIPGVGEASGIVSLGWALVDPVIDDEKHWSPGVVR